MANKKTKKIRKIKKSHPIATFLMFSIIYTLATAFVVGFSIVMYHYIMQSKSNAEFDTVYQMTKLYEKRLKTDGALDSIYDLLSEYDRDYIIKDKNGKLIHQSGPFTAADERHEYVPDTDDVDMRLSWEDDEYSVNIHNEEIEYYLYDDAVHPYVHTKDGNTKLQFKEVFNIIRSSPLYSMDPVDEDDLISDAEFEEALEKELSDAEMEEFVQQKISETKEQTDGVISMGDYSMIVLPYWISISVNDGKEEFIAKAFVTINMTDLAILATSFAFLIIFAIVVFIVTLVYVVNNIVNQKKTNRLLFTDMSTDGHNWMWFLYRGEQFLRKRSTAKNSYAIVNLVFVKYRNYCSCHSVMQGEMLLKKVYYLLGKRLEKKELLAHVSDSDFALLIKYDDVDKLKMRLQSLILELEKIDQDHVFSFQAGAAPVPVNRNENGRIVKRKNFDFESEYNNACTARATIADSDESGVAIFDDKLIEDQRWIDKVTERQRYAIEHEEFIVYYQPKYDPSTDNLKGAEALIRWQNEDMGFVPPGRFIPIFEKNGFITEIDHYMLEHVARDQKTWLDKGFNCVPISVNVSRAHFIESDLAEQIRDIVDRAGTPHKYIEIELTESAFFDDKKALISTITKLKEYGFAVSMDDFGSGYSSLNSLKDMPLDVLKLDAEFFRGDAQGERGEIVVSEAIKLAKSLNMRTVAEGVEIKEQVDFLAQQGCDMIQGYYYAKPMPKDDFEKRM